MLIEAARRIEAAAKEVLALVNADDASCAEMRQMLEVFKAAIAIMTVAQTTAAASIAGRERHGDGGAEVLASGAGLSRQEARSQVKTAEALQAAPKLRDAVESGRVSATNARRLAEAASKTSAADVEDDRDLLAKAESMRPEQFAKEARRWVVERDGDGGESEHAQRQLLIARDGGCFACGAHPDICDAHHVRPVSQGGVTSLDNMVLACWRCHNKIHHFGWQIHGPPGNRTLHPPETATRGPAHASDSPEKFGSGTACTAQRTSLRRSGTPAAPDTPDTPDPPGQPQLLELVTA